MTLFRTAGSPACLAIGQSFSVSDWLVLLSVLYVLQVLFSLYCGVWCMNDITIDSRFSQQSHYSEAVQGEGATENSKGSLPV
jgi:hypothetical protein